MRPSPLTSFANTVRTAFCLIGVLLLSWPGLLAQQARAEADFGAGSAPQSAPHIQVHLISASSVVEPGQALQLALRLVPDDGWHTYWQNPGDTGLPTRLQWDLPERFRAGDIEWPTPERIDFQGAINFGYHGETILPVAISVPAQIDDSALTEDQTLRFAAKAKWLICKDVCIPGNADVAIELPLAKEGNATATQTTEINWAKKISAAQAQVPQLLFRGGAEYAVGEQVNITIDASVLPTLTRPPLVFVGTKQIVDNAEPPATLIDGDILLISAQKDQYLADPPDLLPVVVAVPDANGAVSEAVQFVARKVAAVAAQDTMQADVGKAQSFDVDTQPAAQSNGLLMVLVFALAGGFILNAMPCVFPVLSLKVVSLIESGNHSAALRRQHGMAYMAGVVLSFLVVAAVLIALRLAGEQIGWGFQLQSPLFIAFLIYLLFVLGLSLSGFIEFGAALQNIGSGIASDDQHWRGSFMTGVLATVVATPCTAPFMGTAMGFALSQPIVIALLVFAVMGLGLALPFLLIAFIPALANALPKPGNWMVQLKELLAFPIYLTVVWLIWVLSRQTSGDAVIYILLGLVVLALALWIWRQTLYRDRVLWARAVAASAVVLALGVGFVGVSDSEDSLIRTAEQAQGEESSRDGFIEAAYSPQRLDEALASGSPVFVNMTADWCITCKVNERVALSTDQVKSAFAANSVVYLKGDWTNADPQISEYLARFNRDGVPLYVYYAPGQQPKLLPQLLTAGIVLDALR